MRLGALAIVAVLAASAVAAPTIDIKARTQLGLESVRLRGDGVAEVSGQLLDKLTGDGLANQTLTIRIGPDEITATTGPDGRFRATIAVPPGPQQVELRFEGGALLEASAHTQVADPSRAQVSLALLVEPDPQQPAHQQVIVSATADDQPVPLPVELSVGPPASDQLTPLGTVQAGSPMRLTRTHTGGAGPRRLRASFRGDATRQPATAEVTVEMISDTRTTIAASASRLAFEDELEVTGRVVDDDGRPVARAAVTLQSGDRRLAQSATSADGTYRFEVEAEIIGQGQVAVQVLADPGVSYVKPSRSAPAIIAIAAPQPVPISYTIAAFVATVLAAGGFLFARARPWRRLARPAPAAQAPAPTANEDEQLEGGLVTNRPRAISALRRPSDDAFSGVVRDTVRRRPVPGAVIRLVLGELERAIETGADGSFVLERLTPGHWKAVVTAPGHVTTTFGVSIPHRGELRDARIDLVPVREQVFKLYRRAAAPALPEPRLWGVWSPRQIVDHVRARRPSPALADLTDFVEEVYFSARLAAETILPEASERVERAIRERA